MIAGALIFVYALLICSAPLSRVMVGPMPLYFIDVLAAIILLVSIPQASGIARRSAYLSIPVLLFCVALLPTSLAEMTRMGFSEPFYLLARTVLHVLTLWSLGSQLLRPAVFRCFIVGASIGLSITGSIAIMHSLPTTGPWVRANVMSMELLFPRGVATRFEGEAYLPAEVEAERGNSLVGKSNPTGMVLTTLLPFLLGALRHAGFGPVGRIVLRVALAVILLAALLTYSRATYLGLALILSAYLFLERAALAKRLLPVMVLVFVGIVFVGPQSGLFKFDFIAAKFDLTNEEYAGNNMSRVLSYTRPVELLLRDPSYLVRGAGRTSRKLREADPDAAILDLKDNEMHSVFAASIFYRGFPAMVLLFLIYYRFGAASYRAMRYSRRRKTPLAWLTTAAFVALLALLPHWAFDHHLVNGIGSHAHMFILFALALASTEYTRRFARAESRRTEDVPGLKPAIAGHQGIRAGFGTGSG